MDRSSLLEGDASPNAGGYAPPLSGDGHQERQHLQQQQQQQLQQEQQHDLSLTVTNGDDIPIIEEPSYAQPQLPPLISYCSYVKFGCAFGKWLILIVVANVVGLVIVLSDNYFGWEGYLPFDSWKGLMLAVLWLVTSAWLFLSAKVVEQDVERYDQMAQYEQGRLTEDTSASTSNNMATSAGLAFLPNYNAVYGQVSRKVDVYLAKNSDNNVSPTNDEGGSSNSSLVNASYALWALALGGGVFMLTGSLLGRHYKGSCNRVSNLPTDGSANSTSEFKGDFANINEFPLGIQEWITETKDPWGSTRYYDFDDDYHEDSMVPTYDGQFPSAFESDTGLFCEMNDGTVFFAGQPPVEATGEGDDDDGLSARSDHLVLVEVGNGSTIQYHADVINPRMFLPVGNDLSIDSTNTYKSSSCCFVAANTDEDSKKRQRSWDAIIRTSPIYCIKSLENANDKFVIDKTAIAWTDKSQRGPKLSAASSGDQVLIAHIGIADRYTYQEVVAVTPASMQAKPVYHLTSDNANGVYYEYDERNHEDTKCIQEHAIVFATIATLVVLVLSSLWLLLREGIPSGVTPLIFAIVIAIYGLGEVINHRDSYGYNRFVGGWTNLILTIGTFFFHVVLCCGDNGRRRACPCLPTWIGSAMYCWALYSWLIAFIILDAIAGDGGAVALALVYFGLSGLVQNHPTVIVMGWGAIVAGVVFLVLWPFLGFDVYDLLPGVLSFILGFGMISIGRCFSNNRGYMSAFCRPLSRACHAMFYGSSSGGSASSGSAAVAANIPSSRAGGPIPVRV